MQKLSSLRLVSVVLTVVLVSSCRKNISMPAEESKKLFGNWEWVQTSGGCVPTSTTPSTEGYTRKIEFSEKGICKQYKNNDLENKRKYEINMGKTIYSTDEAFLLEFERRGGIVKYKDKAINQSLQFIGQDTLILRDECSDCYQTMYVRIK